MIAALATGITPCARAQSGQIITRTITLAWDPSPDPTVIGYRLYYGQATGSYPHMIDVGRQTVTDIPNLIEGTTYYFGVSAYRVTGEESYLSEEVRYTPNPALLVNISTRAMVLNGDGVMIAGFIIGGAGEKKAVIRALGPSLAAAGVGGALANPSLEVYGSNGLVASNDDWGDGSPDEISSLHLAPPFASEAALVVRLKPGNYSVIVRGHNGATGLALLEVYDGGS